MSYCSANVINFTLIKSIPKVQRAKFEHVPNVIQEARVCPTCPPGSPIYFYQTESTLWTEVGRAHRPEV